RVQCPGADPAVEGGQRPAPHGPGPADPDRGPVQSTSQEVLRPAGGSRQAADAGHRRLPAEARDDRRRGAQEPRPVRPGLGLTNHPLTTRSLVRRPELTEAPADHRAGCRGGSLRLRGYFVTLKSYAPGAGCSTTWAARPEVCTSPNLGWMIDFGGAYGFFSSAGS